ncbi:DUF5906 domain-containing protein [Variovorax sp. J22P240]|uniref:primase-helicase family protein n=1 Tax=Variovorax sp. J22P240 TaxID=3053514 RepID=UPI00257812F7|nr:primase-helicase family protein [Variovorax sp. J22P240]MDM0002206.1 DUF5906 domain-containing protein [Variovorax sp. J22P240]
MTSPFDKPPLVSVDKLVPKRGLLEIPERPLIILRDMVQVEQYQNWYFTDRGAQPGDLDALKTRWVLIDPDDRGWYFSHGINDFLVRHRWAIAGTILNAFGQPIRMPNGSPIVQVRFLDKPQEKVKGGGWVAITDPKTLKESCPKTLFPKGCPPFVHFPLRLEGEGSYEQIMEVTKERVVTHSHVESPFKADILSLRFSKASYRGNAILLPVTACSGTAGFSSSRNGINIVHATIPPEDYDFRRVRNVIAFDSDTANRKNDDGDDEPVNANVQRDEERFAAGLKFSMNCSNVLQMRLPMREDGGKQGPDDFLAARAGDPTDLLNSLLADPATEPEKIKVYVGQGALTPLAMEIDRQCVFIRDSNRIAEQSTGILRTDKDARLRWREVNLTIKIGKLERKVYGLDQWMDSRLKTQADSVVWEYEGETLIEQGDRVLFNTYRRGEAPWPEAAERLKYNPLVELFESVIPEIKHRNIFLRQFRQAKFTNIPLVTYPVLISSLRGVGKGTIGRVVKRVIGAANVYDTVTEDDFDGRFNAQTKNKRVLIAPDLKLSPARRTRVSGTINVRVGDGVARIEHKGVDIASSTKVNEWLLAFVNKASDAPQDGPQDRRKVPIPVNPPPGRAINSALLRRVNLIVTAREPGHEAFVNDFMLYLRDDVAEEMEDGQRFDSWRPTPDTVPGLEVDRFESLNPIEQTVMAALDFMCEVDESTGKPRWDQKRVWTMEQFMFAATGGVPFATWRSAADSSVAGTPRREPASLRGVFNNLNVINSRDASWTDPDGVVHVIALDPKSGRVGIANHSAKRSNGLVYIPCMEALMVQGRLLTSAEAFRESQKEPPFVVPQEFKETKY